METLRLAKKKIRNVDTVVNKSKTEAKQKNRVYYEAIEREWCGNFVVTQALKRAHDDHQVHAEKEKNKLQCRFTKLIGRKRRFQIWNRTIQMMWWGWRLKDVAADASKDSWLEMRKSNHYVATLQHPIRLREILWRNRSNAWN